MKRFPSALPVVIGRAVLTAILFLGVNAPLTAADFKLSISSAPREISWPSETGFIYRIETSPALQPPAWERLGADQTGTGTTLKMALPAPDSAQRYYRGVRTPQSGGQISPQAVDPTPGQLYAANAILGSPFLGLQFSIPAAWKGGLRQGTSTLLFASDTEPGLVVGFFALSGDAAKISAAIGDNIPAGQFGGFQVQRPPQVTGNQIVVEWAGVGFDDQFNSLQGVSVRCQGVLHPSGGLVAFVGVFAETSRAVIQRVLNDFTQSTVVVPRRTRTDLIDVIARKSFVWVKSANVGSGGTSGSLQRWTQKNAFFCPGTYEITTQSESSFSGNLSGGGFYSGYSNSNSTEAGDWTIIDTDFGPAMIMMSDSGVNAALLTITGNSVIFGDQQFDYQRPHACAP